MAYEFTNRWFETNAINTWNQLFTQFDANKILEIGSFEGKSACYLIENLGSKHDVEITCIDTWEGGEDHQDIKNNMPDVENRFENNIKHAKSLIKNKATVTKIKQKSHIALAELLVKGEQFDFVYVDGSHLACDVLIDAVLGFKLLKKDGLIVFDDYIWYEEIEEKTNPLRSPKMAIDAFSNIFYDKAFNLGKPGQQLYLRKMTDY